MGPHLLDISSESYQQYVIRGVSPETINSLLFIDPKLEESLSQFGQTYTYFPSQVNNNDDNDDDDESLSDLDRHEWSFCLIRGTEKLAVKIWEHKGSWQCGGQLSAFGSGRAMKEIFGKTIHISNHGMFDDFEENSFRFGF